MVWIGKYIFNDGPIPANYIQITRIVGFGIFGLAGFVVMIRGELYQVVIIRGKWARMVGFFWWAFCWWYAIISIFYVL